MYRQSQYSGHRRSRPTYRSFNNAGRRPNRSNRQTINPSRFIKTAVLTPETVFSPQNNFEDFAINPLLKRNLIQRAYTTPSPIQDQAIPIGLSGKDIVGIANTGTGKTAAFLLPILHRIMEDRLSKALIVAPTRELAEQIEAECRLFAKGSGIFGALLIGGTSMGLQLKNLRHNPSIIIGTPGRIKDHTQRGTLKLRAFNIIVLDEVDRMVDMGFITDIRFLLGELATEKQSYFFSATLDRKLEDLARGFLTDPVTISVKTGETIDSVNQDVMRFSSAQDKMEKLHQVLIQDQSQKTLIFDETQRGVERLYRELAERGFKADAIHGGKNQSQRQRALRRFKQNEINVLVATDVAARGIDVVDITHVINYGVPNTYDDYVHRIGRTGRAGRGGQALTFVNA